MCLGAIGRIVERWDEGGVPMATVQLAQKLDTACLLYVPDAAVGDEVLVHLGFAVEVLAADRAAEARELRADLGL